MAVAASRPPGSEGKVLKFDSRFAAEGDDAFGHTFGVKVDGASPRGLWPPFGGGLCSLALRGQQPYRAEGDDAIGHAFGVRVDGASPRGLWPPVGGGLYSLRSGGDSGSAAEGGGGGFAAIFKVSVTRLPSRPHRHSDPRRRILVHVDSDTY